MMASKRDHILNYLGDLRRVLDELPLDAVEAVLDVFERAYAADKTVFICGNGGSHATASHWVCDFSKGCNAPAKRRLRMICLGDNLPMLTAYANDVNYDAVFAEPLRTYARPGDVVVLLTASGNSPNVLAAATAAREIGAITVGLIGFGGGKLAELVDHQITVSSREYGPVEDLHMILDHIISLYMRRVISN
ncbi:SIS domain-containing protein [candidate division KSB1 bacterium]|nr:SIS domain-containing protein [candidate division KSB1 bacterium]